MLRTERDVESPRLPIGVILAIVLVVLGLGARSIASLFIDYHWWGEMGQLDTWRTMILYGFAPTLAGMLIAFAVLWVGHARALKSAGTGLREHPTYAAVSTLALAFVAYVISAANIQSWTVIRYLGGHSLADAAAGWKDPVYGKTLSFFFFDLPFYSHVVGFVLGLSFVAALIYAIASRAWSLSSQIARFSNGAATFDISDLRLGALLDATFVRALLTIFLAGVAASLWLSRYNMVLNDHGFLVGMDWVDEHVELPLQWAAIAACGLAAAFVWMRAYKLAAAMVLVFAVRAVLPSVVSTLYVKPNELSLQKPYIAQHIEATRRAYNIESRIKEVQYAARIEGKINLAKYRPQLENVRLWDWRAFRDTVTQLQALRQYYVFKDIDVDRYTMDGQLHQVMIAPREIDVRQLAGTTSNWINSHLVYTHGYGLVMADANKIEASGQPALLIENAPPKINTPSVKLTRPEIYYGEVTHEPVFVQTKQPEFNYPSGSENVHTEYEGKGGFPADSFGVRLAAAFTRGDWNILLTGYLNPNSRMMIRRNVLTRVNELADFLTWDADPYLVITDAGRLVWILDGYTSSDRHPYSRHLSAREGQRFNYIRNSVKATVDAYDGTVTLYVFDEQDPLIRAWQNIFPSLFRNQKEMPADLRSHARQPEMSFRAQSEIYRTFHMRDPEAFYNKEDLWDFAKNVYEQGEHSEGTEPMFVIATLPGETKPEFLMIQPFTPRSKDNLIGLMAARCDGEHLGELVVLQLSKQSLIYGPLQVEARIDSDQNISKDLSLWNQQGSKVVRGQMLVLPIENEFLYIEPIYIQSSQAKMPQLKKVVLAMGNTLIYRDTYEQALAELVGSGAPPPPAPAAPNVSAAAGAATNAPAPPPAGDGRPAVDGRVDEVRRRLQRYRELSSQGKWAEAGRELEAIEAVVKGK